MWVREAFFRWLLPSAFLLPLWLLVGWGVFRAGGWSFLGVILISMPSVFVGQLLLTALIRSRPSVRASRAVSWLDVAGVGLWHVLTVLVGCYIPGWSALIMVSAIIVAVLVFASSLKQLAAESGGQCGLRTTVRRPDSAEPAPTQRDVFIIREQREP